MTCRREYFKSNSSWNCWTTFFLGEKFSQMISLHVILFMHETDEFYRVIEQKNTTMLLSLTISSSIKHSGHFCVMFVCTGLYCIIHPDTSLSPKEETKKSKGEEDRWTPDRNRKLCVDLFHVSQWKLYSLLPPAVKTNANLDRNMSHTVNTHQRWTEATDNVPPL